MVCLVVLAGWGGVAAAGANTPAASASAPTTEQGTEAKPQWRRELDERARRLEYQLRCVMCQSESIAESHSKIAQAMRQQVRRMVDEGKSDQEIKAFFVQRYGEFVLMEPTKSKRNWPLWFGPVVLVLAGVVVVVVQFRRRRTPAPAGEGAQEPPTEQTDAMVEQARRLLEDEP